MLGKLFVELTYLQQTVKQGKAAGKASASERASAAGADAADERAKRLGDGLLKVRLGLGNRNSTRQTHHVTITIFLSINQTIIK